MLGQRLRRWPNINSASGHWIVFGDILIFPDERALTSVRAVYLNDHRGVLRINDHRTVLGDNTRTC